MPPIKRLVLLCVALFVVVACHPTPTPVPPDQPGPHFLLTTSGPVQLNRDSWPDYVPVAFGTALQTNDLLRIEGQAKVLCANLAVKMVSSGEKRTPCSPGPGILAYREVRFVFRRSDPTQTSAHEDIPYARYPRGTLVLDSRPPLRWHDTEASSYTVQILVIQDLQPLWTKTGVTGNHLLYPADEPALQSDMDYRLIVVDDDSQVTSRVDEPPGTGFRLATEAELTTLEARRDEIMAVSDLDDAERDFVLGVYYAGLEPSESGFSPLGEAWRSFEELAQTQDAPVVDLWRGDVLATMQLPAEAEAAYRAALDKAQMLGDQESQAVANARLWQMTGDDAYFDEAIALYEQLGDEAQMEALRREKDRS